MSNAIKVPTLGESVSEATVAQWLKKEGDVVNIDDPLVELETDKVTLEVNATAAGVLSEIKVQTGENVEVGAVLGFIQEGAVANDKGVPAKKAEEKKVETVKDDDDSDDAVEDFNGKPMTPAVRKMIENNKLDASKIDGTGKGGRILKGDVLAFLEKNGGMEGAKKPEATKSTATAPAQLADYKLPEATSRDDSKADREERVKMTRLRQKIAERLKSAQNTAAILTTFNEVDMSNLMALRNEYKDAFEKKHGVRLGFMSFFVKAAVKALKEFPAVNGEINGTDIIYKNYYDISVAVSTPAGLVVPVIRDADKLSFAEIEKSVADLGLRARDGKLSMEEMSGGTFTITNGGVFGSLMATPILNPPQSGILGMHKVEERPVAINGQVVIRPMMYIALSYDHRIIDGRESVSFLVRVKEAIEDPQRLLLEV